MLQTIPDQVVTINKQKLARLKVARKRYVVNVSAAKKKYIYSILIKKNQAPMVFHIYRH